MSDPHWRSVSERLRRLPLVSSLEPEVPSMRVPLSSRAYRDESGDNSRTRTSYMNFSSPGGILRTAGKSVIERLDENDRWREDMKRLVRGLTSDIVRSVTECIQEMVVEERKNTQMMMQDEMEKYADKAVLHDQSSKLAQQQESLGAVERRLMESITRLREEFNTVNAEMRRQTNSIADIRSLVQSVRDDVENVSRRQKECEDGLDQRMTRMCAAEVRSHSADVERVRKNVEGLQSQLSALTTQHEVRLGEAVCDLRNHVEEVCGESESKAVLSQRTCEELRSRVDEEHRRVRDDIRRVASDASDNVRQALQRMHESEATFVSQVDGCVRRTDAAEQRVQHVLTQRSSAEAAVARCDALQAELRDSVERVQQSLCSDAAQRKAQMMDDGEMLRRVSERTAALETALQEIDFTVMRQRLRDIEEDCSAATRIVGQGDGRAHVGSDGSKHGSLARAFDMMWQRMQDNSIGVDDVRRAVDESVQLIGEQVSNEGWKEQHLEQRLAQLSRAVDAVSGHVRFIGEELGIELLEENGSNSTAKA